MSVFRRKEDKEESSSSGRHGAIVRNRRGPGGSGHRGSRSGDGGADAQEQFIIDALHDLHDTVVREVMTPRVDVVALSIPLTVDAVSRAVRESGHSCFPVFGDDLDDLIGVLFVNDLFRAGWKVGGTDDSGVGPAGPGTTTGDDPADRRAPPPSLGNGDPAAAGNAPVPVKGPARPAPDPLDISRRLRQPFLVPESGLVLEVLAEMRRQRRAFAVVVDEHGGVEGVLTVKDLLGALVGDLPDEFDPDDEPEVVRVDGSRWLVDGRTSVDDVSDRLEINVPEGEYVTLGGFLFDAFGHIPEEGEKLEVDGWELRVAEMDKRRIAKVVAKRLPTAPPPADGAPGGD